MAWRAPAGGAFVRVLQLPTSTDRFASSARWSPGRRCIALAFALVAHRRDDARSCASRTSAPRCARSRATARSRPRWACPCAGSRSSAWLGSGIVCGVAGLLLADLFTSLDYTALTFLVISSLAAALIGRLRSLWVTLAGGLAVGLAAGRRHAVLRRSRPTAARRRSCSRSSRCSISAATARSRSRGRRGSGVLRLATAQVRRSTRGASSAAAPSIAVFLGVVLFVLPAVLGGDWIKTLTGVAIYAVVAAGLVTLYGRVGMISLGQIALLAIGTWTATRLSLRHGPAVPGAAARHRRDHLRRRRADRPAGTAAERPLPRAHHADGGRRRERRADDDQLPERRRRLHRATPRRVDLSGLAARRRPGIAGGDTAYYRYTIVVCALMFLLIAAALRLEARARLGVDPRERAGGARGGREHRPLQALGVRAGVVHDRRGGLPAGRAARPADARSGSRRRTRSRCSRPR